MDDPASEWQPITWQELQAMRPQPVGKYDRLMDRLQMGEILGRDIPDRNAAHWLKIALGQAAARRGMKFFPNAGHILNLQRNAPTWFAIAAHWSDRHFGPCPQGCR